MTLYATFQALSQAQVHIDNAIAAIDKVLQSGTVSGATVVKLKSQRAELEKVKLDFAKRGKAYDVSIQG